MNSNSFQSTAFYSSVLGEVSHPINIIREYRRVLPKSAARIVSAIDGWVRTHQKDPKKYSAPEWVYAPADNLAKQIDLCRDTVQRWLGWLVEQGYLIREFARRWPTDRAYKYCISDKLWSAMQFAHWNAQPFSLTDKNQAMDSRKSEDAKQMFPPSMPRKSATSYIPLKSTDPPTQEEGARSPEEEKEEEGQEELLAKPDIEPEIPASQLSVSVENNVPRGGHDPEKNLTEKLKDRLAECQIPLDQKVVDAIEKHHISQVYGALAHIENTWETIDNPRAVFLYQLPKQPIETLGCRQPLYTAANAPGMDVEASEPPPGFFDALRRKFGRK